jgi:hypothetical protein
MSHALATVLHRGRKAASNIMSACLASSRGSAPKNGARVGVRHLSGRVEKKRPADSRQAV